MEDLANAIVIIGSVESAEVIDDVEELRKAMASNKTVIDELKRSDDNGAVL